jgi:Ca2+-binding RTX toxin-like protein
MLSGLTVANLTDTGSGNTFTVTGWTHLGSLTGNSDTVIAAKNANFTLTNISLATSDGMNLALAGFTEATLTSGATNKTFAVGGWTGSGTLTGTGVDTVLATKDANFTLTDHLLSTSDGMSLTLTNVTKAKLAESSIVNRVLDASGYNGSATLTGGSGNDILLGGSGSDSLMAGTGRDILIGGAGASTLVAGAGDDILIAGTTTDTLAALNAVMAEWESADSFSLRVSDIANGGGANGSNELNPTTVAWNHVADRLVGNPSAHDWFFARTTGSPKDVITNYSIANDVTTAI